MATEESGSIVKKEAPKKKQPVEKLDLINGFANLRGKKLVKTEGPVADKINDEYNEWVEKRISSLMGEATENGGFTADEFAALKEMAQQIIARKAAPQAPTQPQQVAPQPTALRPGQRAPRNPMQPKQPIQNPSALRPVDTSKIEAANKAILGTFVTQLDRMDAEGPVY
jgi:hypothetical protein